MLLPLDNNVNYAKIHILTLLERYK